MNTKKNTNPKWFLMIVSMLVSAVLSAQPLEIRGTILDAVTQEPLPYANIVCGQEGTSSNQDGKFILHLSKANTNDRVSIRYIGYQSIEPTVAELIENSNIQLVSHSEVLEGVTVYSGENIIEDLINHYQINYEFNDLLLKAYYKESIQNTSSYLYIGEGLFDIYLPTIYSEDETTVSSIKTRKKEFNGIDSVQIPHVTGHVSDMVNAATRRKSSFLTMEGHKHYTFTKEEYSFYDGREIFKLHFEPKDKHGNSSGTLYVDAESKAIIKADYYPLIENQYFWSFAHWTEEFKEIEGTWYIHRVSYEGEWIDQNKVFTYHADMVITDSKVTKSTPQLSHEISDTASFFDEASDFGSGFWEEQNHMLLTEEEQLALASRQ
ncbi:carboxypeptidase-like regulatory domain-containing protein [Reichenbachiella ulvae]|uniref:Carboxypeptidase-like regulatory domain-containing protein n=1 Tax=Reichenbachiella ulvae TaxID=2980104 RepID=A0ABT3CNT1_9BACT|nr:carboxypeptidase-like regulatory domain-containing protein [Reichenbachiella ulvae]MCV9385375.1 carboxypeptidase-like regulatory domain-containing protein [Reichenbachiella ulvae]